MPLDAALQPESWAAANRTQLTTARTASVAQKRRRHKAHSFDMALSRRARDRGALKDAENGTAERSAIRFPYWPSQRETV
jgi:hypothetical protein